MFGIATLDRKTLAVVHGITSLNSYNTGWFIHRADAQKFANFMNRISRAHGFEWRYLVVAIEDQRYW